MQYFARSGALLGFPELVRELGGNPIRLLQSVGLSSSVLQDPDLYLPYLSLTELYTLAAEACNEPAFGVLLGSRQGLEVVGALGSFVCLQSTVGEAFVLVRKNLDFHARGVSVDADLQDGVLSLTLALDFKDELDCTQVTALSVALLAQGLRQLHEADIPPIEVLFSFDLEGPIEPYQRLFACPVRFGEGINQIRYPLALMYEPVSVAPELRTRLTTRWRHGLSLNQPATLQQKVERAITALLPTGECSLAMVAHLVDMPSRTLQYELSKMQSSFGGILQNTRLQLAQQHMQQSDMDLTTLALNLGFADLAAFSRAYKLWTGLSPRAWRNQAR